MAGLFGLFNYEKEGPGIDKNAPQKHGFIVFFETFFRNFWKFIPINLVYCLVSLLIITNGFAKVGITHVARNTARDKHSFGLSDFFDTIKKNKKQAFVAGIINALIYGLMAVNLYFYWFFSKGIMQSIGLGFIIAAFFIFTIMNYYLWTLIITFDYKLKQAYMNSFRFVFINLKYNLLVFFVNVLLLAAAIGIVFLFPKYFLFILTIEFLLYIAIYPCFNALLIQFCTFPSIKKYIIDPYYEKHPDADIEKRHDMGLKTQADILAEQQGAEEDDEDDSDVIFND